MGDKSENLTGTNGRMNIEDSESPFDAVANHHSPNNHNNSNNNNKNNINDGNETNSEILQAAGHSIETHNVLNSP